MNIGAQEIGNGASNGGERERFASTSFLPRRHILPQRRNMPRLRRVLDKGGAEAVLRQRDDLGAA